MAQKVGGLTSGCIAAVHSTVPAFFSGMNILFTVRDSSTKTFFTVKDFELNRDFMDVNVRLFVAAQSVSEFVEKIPFINFTELYFLPEFYPPPRYYTTEVVTTDISDFNEGITDAFLSTFEKYGAVRYLSEGCGLNYYCDAELALALKKMYDD